VNGAAVVYSKVRENGLLGSHGGSEMLMIRKAQVEALAIEMVLEFEDRLLAHIRSCVPGAAKTPELRQFIRAAVQQAAIHGFQTEMEVARYTVALKKLDIDPAAFARHEWLKVLLDAKMRTGAKLDRLEDAVLYQKEARRIRDGR
jgi:hypothetical protein